MTTTRKILVYGGTGAMLTALCLLLAGLVTKSVPLVFWGLGFVVVNIAMSLVEEFLRGDEEEETAR